MRVKMFVPAFDEDFLEIVITQWLKREMSEVKEGELIAIAETYQTTCEITAETTGILCEIALPEKSICRSGDVLCSIFEGTLEDYRRLQDSTMQHNSAPTESFSSSSQHEVLELQQEDVMQGDERFESIFTAPKKEEHKTHHSTEHHDTEEPKHHHKSTISEHKHKSTTAEHHHKTATHTSHKTATHHKKKAAADDADMLPGVNPYTWNTPQFFEDPDAQQSPLNPMRKKILDDVRNALHESFLCSVMDEVDMSSIMQIQSTLGNDFEQKHHIPLGFTAFFIKAIIGSLKRYPVFNAYVRHDNIVYRKEYDISLYMHNSSKMVAPVLRSADKMSIMMLQKNIIALNKRAQSGELTLEECNRGSFSIINAGIYGALFSTDIVPPMQVAALSIHKLQRRPVVIDDRVEVRPMTYISMTYDHRVADISEAASFLSNVKRYVENPSFAMLDLE